MSALALALLLAGSPTELPVGGTADLDGAWELRLSDAEGPTEAGAWRSARVPGNLAFQGVEVTGPIWILKRFTTPAGEGDLALRLPMTSNASEVYVNGAKIGGRGRLAPDGEVLEKDFRSVVHRVPRRLLRTDGPNVLLLRLGAFYGNAGVEAPGIWLGDEQVIRDAHHRSIAWIAMLVSLFLFAAFFHLVLFFGRARERYYLSFAGMSIGLASITAGINTLGYLLSDSPDFNAYLVFVPILVLPWAFVAFFADFFSQRVDRLRRGTMGFGVAGLAVLIASTLHHPLFPFVEKVVLPLAALLLGVSLLLVAWWTGRAVREEQLGARAVLVGLVAYAVTGVLELAWTFALVPFHVNSNLGFAFFTGAMVVAIATRFDWLHRQAELGERDLLTGCFTRRGFLERASRILGARPAGSVIMFDLDHFKRVNDEHGHQMGDRVLHTAGQVVRRVVRNDDLVARWGGEEFVVLLPEMSQAGAEDIARRIQRAFRTERVDGLSFTASLGIAERGADESLDRWIARADRALYDAKNSGRDCIRLAG